MNDLIRRQAAIAEFSCCELTPDGGIDANYAIDFLEQMPSAQQWIPCSERLPEEYGNYLITTYEGDVDIGTIDPNRKNVWSACNADGFYWVRNVIAWMPLPEPYKGVTE